jgi:hypothetical protein
MTGVLIADDHALVRDGLRHILQGASGFEVVGEACDSTSAIALMRVHAADVLVPDLSMPGRNGVIQRAFYAEIAHDPTRADHAEQPMSVITIGRLTSPPLELILPRFTTPAFESPENLSESPFMNAQLQMSRVEATKRPPVLITPEGPTMMPWGLIT